MADFSKATMTFLFIGNAIVLAVLLIWAFWSLEQWRVRKDILRRIDPFDVRRRIRSR